MLHKDSQLKLMIYLSLKNTILKLVKPQRSLQQPSL